MAFTTVAVVILISILVVRVVKWLGQLREFKRIINKIPGPDDGYPIIGNVLSMFVPPDQQWRHFRKMALEFYPIYRYWHMQVPVLNILCPEDMEIVLSTTKHITKSIVYDQLHPWLRTGLLTSTGIKWQRRRKILTPSFHFNILQQFMAIFTEESEELVQKLNQECENAHTDVVPFITYFTLKTICETAMGTRLNEEDKSSREYMGATYKMGELVLTRLTYPWYHNENIFKLTSMHQEQKKLLNILHGFSTSVIEKRKINFTEPNLVEANEQHDDVMKKKRLAMLDLLISAKNSGEPIDDKGIQEEVDTFMFEGHDTTTACICFTLLALACHADIQEKVVKELREVFGNSKRPPTYQDLQNLPYLDQVLKESLRMYPSVPFISRVSEEEIKTHSGYIIPANIILQLHIYDLHHNPKVYPDPERFDPERFTMENMQKRHPFAYIPFSAGPRNCIGQKFALLEIKTVISSILRNFTLEAVDTPSDISFICHLVLKSKSGVKIKFKKRNL